MEQFIPWACILFLFSILIIFVSYKRARDEDEKRSLYIITGILITSFILYIACFIFRAREIPYIGSYLIMFMQLITFLYHQYLHIIYIVIIIWNILSKRV